MADRNQTFELFEKLVSGDTKETILKLQEQYKNGANPTSLLQDLINITHLLAKTKLVPSFINDSSLSEAERELCQRLNAKVSIAVLSKIWQMMIKGLGELQVAPVQIDALEMILIRVAYSANLPTPYELLNDVKKTSNLSAVVPSVRSPGTTPVLGRLRLRSLPPLFSQPGINWCLTKSAIWLLTLSRKKCFWLNMPLRMMFQFPNSATA